MYQETFSSASSSSADASGRMVFADLDFGGAGGRRGKDDACHRLPTVEDIQSARSERAYEATAEAELTWTAPGGDLDAPGTAATQYEIRCYTDRSALNDSSAAILVHASLTPQPEVAGSVQLAKVAVP